MTPEERAQAFEAWDTGNRPPPNAEAALVRAIRAAKNQAYEDAARVFDEMVPECCLSPKSVAAAIRELKP